MGRLSVAIALLGWLWSGRALADPALTVSGAWIPEAPPTARVQAAYLELVNRGSTPLEVLEARSPDFSTIEIHRTVHAEGIARMQKQAVLRIEPGTSLTLAPGGLHLMLIEPKRRLVAGDRVELELRLQDGTSISTGAEVRQGTAPADAHAHHHR
jgi:hypothetical protein